MQLSEQQLLQIILSYLHIIKRTLNLCQILNYIGTNCIKSLFISRMKKITYFLLLALLSNHYLHGQKLKAIKATSIKADYRIGSRWVKGNWNISPEISPDVLTIICRHKSEKFVFYTDIDSIDFELFPNKSYPFYVLINNKDSALTEIKCEEYKLLSFNSENNNYKFLFEEKPDTNNYLNTLRTTYKLDNLIDKSKSDADNVLKVLNWVHSQWNHDGMNEPSKNDALTILKEAHEGKSFRCVEYGIVTAACLNALGFKARTLGLQTKDVETAESGAGHVLTEVWLNDLQKWAMLDGQWNAMPVLNNIPLNAVELQKAIVTNYDSIEIKSLSASDRVNYIEWISPYLFYFVAPFDNREILNSKPFEIEGKSHLMLVPTGAKEPKKFQKKWDIDYCIYSNSLHDFYKKL